MHMRLRRYAVLDARTRFPMKVFWTLKGAARWYREFVQDSVLLCRWTHGMWQVIDQPLQGQHSAPRRRPDMPGVTDAHFTPHRI